MSSHVIIKLDTIAPHIDIYAPGYTTKDVVNVITIEANKVIDNYQEIYVIDDKGARTDYTFERSSSNTLTGRIKFSDMIGIVTIYARLRDEVGNYSNLASKSLQVKESLDSLTISVSDRVATISLSTKEATLLTNSRVRSIGVKDENISNR